MIMRSACPSCLNMIEHEDHLFEVQCDCGTRFNPFMTPGDKSGEAPLLKEPTLMAAAEQSVSGLSESEAAFEDIRSFGERLGVTDQPQPSMIPPASIPTPSVSSSVPTATGSLPLLMDCVYPNRVIETYLLPVSTCTQLDLESENPLKSGFSALSVQAQAQGAEAVVCLRCSPMPDGQRVLLTGVPVRFSKLS